MTGLYLGKTVHEVNGSRLNYVMMEFMKNNYKIMNAVYFIIIYLTFIKPGEAC